MKNQKAVICAILSIFAVSCSHIELEPETAQTAETVQAFGDDILMAYTEQPAPSTRTALLGDSTTVVWSKNDALDLLSSDGQKSAFGIVSGVGESSASFSGTIKGNAPYYALYPSSEASSLSDDEIRFSLPNKQTYAANSFGVGCSPALAKMDDPSSGLMFRNLCGLLCINLQGVGGMGVTKIVLHDLGGNMLWGDCKLKLDGAGTNEQKMEITGGDNTLTLEMPTKVSLTSSTPKKFYFVVPQGALDRGFAAVIYDAAGAVYNILETQNPAVTIERSHTSNMVPYKLVETKNENADVAKRGFYKDIFMDGGIALTSRTTLPAATSFLGWSMEYLASKSTANLVQADTTMQKAIIIGDSNDDNGVLLYPDGAPRFRCIYVNGGKSPQHGRSLGATGRQRIYDFVYNGGSYVGTCAGALLASNGYDGNVNYQYYLSIYPGHTYHTGMSDTYTDMTIPASSPLLKYYDFGGDNLIEEVYHNGGCYMSTATKYSVPGTEKLLYYANCPSGSTSNNGRVSSWAYKPDKTTGRMVLIGSHPEGVSSGEKRDLMAAMLRYAVDGIGDRTVKADMKNGTKYSMTATTGSKAGIGDKQYHHYTVTIPEGAKNIKVNLTCSNDKATLYLSMHKGSWAFFTESEYVLSKDGGNKSLNIKTLPAGKWYISVYCPQTVTASTYSYVSGATSYKYSGNTFVLNGVPYTLTAQWE